MLKVALKAADLGHLCEELPVHRRWVGALEEECFRQGDLERANGLPISPLFDRTKPGLSKSQVRFFNVVVTPLYQALAAVFPRTQPLLSGARRNYRHWLAAESGARASAEVATEAEAATLAAAAHHP
jgi:hypothetical protein